MTNHIRIIILFLFSFSLFSCLNTTDKMLLVDTNDLSKTKLTGVKVEILHDGQYKSVQEIRIENKQDYILEAEKSTYYNVYFKPKENLSKESHYNQVFLNKGEKIRIVTNEQTCKIEATASGINKYMLKWSNQYNEMLKVAYNKFANFDKKEAAILKYSKEAKSLLLDSKLDRAFVDLQSKAIDVSKHNAVLNICFSSRSNEDVNKDFKEETKAFIEKQVIDDSKVLNIPNGLEAFNSNFKYEIVKCYVKGETPDVNAMRLTHFTNSEVNSFFLFKYLMQTKRKGEYESRIISQLENKLNPRHKNELAKYVERYSTPIYDFEFETINGEKKKISDLKGKTVYIDFWATWCMPCKQEVPYLEVVEKALHGKKIVFLSISVDDSKEKWRKFAKKNKMHGMVAWIPGGFSSNKLASKYKIHSIPRFMIVDKDGHLIDADAIRPSDPNLRSVLMEII